MTDLVPADVLEALKFAAQLEADRNADLHPDLVDYLETGTLGKMLRHPLVYEVPFFTNGTANRAYAAKKKALAEAERERDWFGCVFLHERAYRTEALVNYVLGVDDEGRLAHSLDQLPPADRDTAMSVWTDCENIAQNLDIWNVFFDVPDECGLLVGDSEAFAALPDPITLYRGDCIDGGWSWSTREEVALFFARRWNDNWPLLTGTVEKRHVFGYLTNRSEDEILVARKHVTVTSVQEVL